MHEYCVSVDIAKKRDYTAIMVFRDRPNLVEGIESLGQGHRFIHTYDIMHIDKFQCVSYPEITDIVSNMMEHHDLKSNADLLVDGSGVGAAVVDLMRDRFLTPIPIIFTGPGKAREVYADMGNIFSVSDRLKGARILNDIHVPKVDMVAAARILTQQRRFRMTQGLKWADEFERQMLKFRGKVNEKTGHVRHEAETEDTHDDLVVCLLMAAWWFNRDRRDTEIVAARTGDSVPEWNPMDFV